MDFCGAKKIYQISPKQALYATTTDNTSVIAPWAFNRTPDEARILAIAKFENEYQMVDGIIYVAQIASSQGNCGGYYCYDGLHRLLSFKYLNKPLRCLIQILWNSNDQEITQEFTRLNMAISVPEIYINPESEILKQQVNETADLICKTWKHNVSSANKPRLPNFNRDGLKDKLTPFFRSHLFVKPKDFVINMKEYNASIKANPLPSNLKQSATKKAENSESQLFLYNWIVEIEHKYYTTY